MLKKFYLSALTIILVLAGTNSVLAQCGLQVDIEAIPRTNICLGESVDLLAKTNLSIPIPTVCGLNADRTCGTGADSIGLSVGTGTIVNGYNKPQPDLFGDFGEAQSRSQIIYLADELKSQGFKGGKITSLALDIARLEVGKNHTIPNFSIKMGCTSSVNFGTNSFLSGLDEVYSPKSVTFTTTGQVIFKFDKAFDWDGVGNIAIEFCAYTVNGTNSGSVDWGTFTRDHAPGFISWIQSTSSNSNGDCVFAATPKTHNQRPNIRFNICKPKVVNLTYQWTPSDGLSTVSGDRTTATPVNPTRYYLKVTKTDDPTCTSRDSIDISVDDPSLFTPTVNSPICEGGTLQFNANTTGVTYSWSGPSFNSAVANPSIPSVTTAAAGTYTFLVDKGFCRATKTLQVEVQAIPKTGTAVDSTVCGAETKVNLRGLLLNKDAGGSWSDVNGSGILNGENINPSLLNNASLPKTYPFKYTITNVCGTYSTTVNVTAQVFRFAGIDDDTTLCETGAPINLFPVLDGSSIVTGGTWFDDNATGKLSGSTFTPTNLGPGTYNFSYVVTGIAPCKNETAKVTVKVSDQPFAGVGSTVKICTNGAINLFNALLNSPKPGGTWSDVNTSGGSLNTSTGAYTATNVVPGTYRFKYKVPAVAPCLADSTTMIVIVQGPPQITNVVSTCAPDKSTYTVTFNISGGDPATYSVTPAGTITGSGPATYTSTAVPDATAVSFKASDANNCSFSTASVLKRCACPTQAGTVKTSPALQVCNSGSVTVTHNGGYVNDGDDTLMYVLHSGSGVALVGVLLQQSTPSFSYVAGAGINYGQTYYISAVAGNKLANNLVDLTDQCLSVSQGVPVVFGVINPPTFNFSVNPACPGDNVTLTSSATGSPSYNWTGPNNFTSTLQNPSVNNVKDINAGDYVLTISSNGCSLSTTKTLTVVPTPVISISADPEICQGQSGFLYINVTAASEIRVYYNTSPGSITGPLLQPGLNKIPISPTVNSTYTLVSATYPGAGGCTYILTGAASVNVVSVPTAAYAALGDSAFCFNESNIGKVKFTFKPGVSADLVYSVNGVIKPSVTSITDGYILEVPATTPGKTVFDVESMKISAGTCEFNNSIAPINFYNLINPVVTPSVDKLVLCDNDSVKVSFKVETSGKVAIDYTLNSIPFSVVTDKDTAVYLKLSGNTVLNIIKASYQIENTCSRAITSSYNILAKPIPVISVDVTTTECNNTNTGSIKVTSSSPTDQYSLDGSGFGSNSTFNNLFSGFHTLQVQSANGCMVTRQVEIISKSNLSVTTDVISTSCGYNDGSVKLTAVNGKAPYTVLFNGEVAPPGIISGLSPGTYPVLVIDANNCIKTSEVVILPSIPITVSLTDNGPIDCTAPEYSQVTVKATGGTGTYTYSVPGKPAQPDSIFHGLWPQTYVLTVRDDRGCTTTKQFKLTSLQKFSITPTILTPLQCYESKDAKVQINLTGATMPAFYSLDNSVYQSSNVFNNVGPGNFQVFVKEEGGCRREQTISFGITRPQPIKLTVKSSGEPSCFNTPDGFVILQAAGGSLEPRLFTVDGTNYKSSAEFAGLTKGNYILIAKNANECHSDTINFHLNGPEDIVVSSSFTFNANMTTATLTITATGGVGTLYYSVDGFNFFENNVFTNLEPKSYTVYVKDNNNCTALHEVRISGSSISETSLSKSVSIAPNPFGRDFKVSSVSVRIMNALGEEVFKGSFREIGNLPQHIQPTDALSPGLYSLELQSDQGTTIRKLIKQ
ncbi:MAG: hypothetical protein V4616_10565 [Bacteroidota bacterium]